MKPFPSLMERVKVHVGTVIGMEAVAVSAFLGVVMETIYGVHRSNYAAHGAEAMPKMGSSQIHATVMDGRRHRIR